MLVCAIPGTNLGENGEGVKGLHGVGMDWGDSLYQGVCRQGFLDAVPHLPRKRKESLIRCET